MRTDIHVKCDLAEAYYQRALTYQKMGDDRAQADFAEALRLWGPDQIDAPKQIERIQKSMNTPPAINPKTPETGFLAPAPSPTTPSQKPGFFSTH